MSKLVIEVDSINELIDYLYRHITSGDLRLLRDITQAIDVDGTTDIEAVKENMSNRNLLGNEGMGKPSKKFASLTTSSDQVPIKKKRAEKETAMCTTYANTFAVSAAQGDTRTEAQQAKDYLIRSLDQEISRKREELEQAFGLNGDYPRTLDDLKKYIENGWVKVSKYAEEAFEGDERIYSPSDYLDFTNPDFKTDREGFKKAAKQMTKDASDVKDAIVVFGPEKGLEALNAFKAKDFH